MKRLIDQAWHRLRGMEFIPDEVINQETGTLDFNCTCLICKWLRPTSTDT